MKQKIIIIILAMTILTFNQASRAVLKGPYGALGLGQTRIQIPAGNFFNAQPLGGQTTTMVGELDGKIMLGYNFFKYFGVEGSFADYARSQYSAYVVNGPSAHLKYTMSALNLVGKGYLPFSLAWLKIDIYGLAGFAYTFSNVNYMNTGVPFANDVNASAFTLGGTNTSSIRPIVGAGVNYDIPKTAVSLAIEFTRISGIGNLRTNERAIPSAEMLTLNIYYNFSPLL